LICSWAAAVLGQEEDFFDNGLQSSPEWVKTGGREGHQDKCALLNIYPFSPLSHYIIFLLVTYSLNIFEELKPNGVGFATALKLF